MAETVQAKRVPSASIDSRPIVVTRACISSCTMCGRLLFAVLLALLQASAAPLAPRDRSEWGAEAPALSSVLGPKRLLLSSDNA